MSFPRQRSDTYQSLTHEEEKEILRATEFIIDPRCDIYRKENFAITMAYLAVGIVMSMLQTPLNVYMVETLNAEPPLQNTIAILQTLPWSLKLIFGFISDVFPIMGMQRKPYLTIGALLYSFSFMLYGIMGQNSVVLLSICIFMGTLGLIQMDVMADTMCVQRSRYEQEEIRGQMQASFYSIRFAGGLAGAIIGACLCNKDSWGYGLTYHQVSMCMGLIPFVLVVPWLFSMRERYRVSEKWLTLISRRNTEILERRNTEIGERGSGATSAVPAGNVNYGSVTESSPLMGEKTQSPSVQSPKKQQSRTSRSGSAAGPMDRSTDGDVELGDRRAAEKKKEGGGPSRGPSRNNGERVRDDDESTDTDYKLQEEPDPASKVHPIIIQFNDIWETVQLKSVWRPMLFVYTYNLLQIPNVAWQSYLQLTLHFPPWILGLTVILGSFMTFAGVMAYKNFFFKTSWRRIYIGTMCLTTFFSLLQIVLIFQWNTKYLHMSNYFFSLGDDVISAYISGIQFLPVCIMYMRLCPDGAEGASYSMLTTFGNIALVCGSNLGNMLAGMWDVSNGALREGNVDGLWKLSLLTSGLALLPILWLRLLPSSPEEQDELAKTKERSKVAGVIFLVVLFGSLAWTSISAIMRVAENE